MTEFKTIEPKPDHISGTFMDKSNLPPHILEKMKLNQENAAMSKEPIKSAEITMDPKEYLKLRGLKNPPLDSGISGGGDAPRQYASLVMVDFAKKYSQHRLSEIIRDSINKDSRISALEAENQKFRKVLINVRDRSIKSTVIYNIITKALSHEV